MMNNRELAARLEELVLNGTLEYRPGTVMEVEVFHDPGCPLLKGGDCDCNPEFGEIPAAIQKGE